MSQFTKEYNRLSSEIEKIRKNLSNENFIKNAPKNIIELNEKKLTDFSISLDAFMNSVMDILNTHFNYQHKHKDSSIIDTLKKYTAEDRIRWHVEFMRDQKYFGMSTVTNLEEIIKCLDFSDEYLNTIYADHIQQVELVELADTIS